MPACQIARVLTLVVILSASAAATSVSCCSLTREELEGLSGTGDVCPSTSSVGDRLEKPCTPCPAGTCRVLDECFCPKYFLQVYDKNPEDLPNYSLPMMCARHFGGKAWPESAEEGDRFAGGCGNTPVDFGTKSCCALTERELIAASGTSELCPKTYFFQPVKKLGEKCESCPDGTCRVDMECFCPFNFLTGYESGSEDAWVECNNSFKAPWPESVGKEDIDWRSCNTNESTSAQVTNPPSTAAGGNGDADSEDPKVTEDSSDENEQKGVDDDDIVEGPSKEESGINWEKWGGIWGGVGVVLTAVFGIFGVWYSRRQAN